MSRRLFFPTFFQTAVMGHVGSVEGLKMTVTLAFTFFGRMHL